MVIGEAAPTTEPGQVTAPPAVLQEKIDNIMGGISNTGTVKMNNHRKKLRQRFDIIKKLGQGTYGKVQLGINKETGQEVAIKTIKKCKIESESDLIRIRREVQIMSSVQHPNIIHIYEVFENREKMVLVMKYAAGGELYDYLSERKVLVEDEARRIFRQIATAVYYCHKHKICHRDLKLENILLDEHGNAKIADFGLSNVFDEQRLLSTYCGSPLYASPEIVKGTPYQGPEVDCWSLGVLLYTLVYGAMPFDGSQFKRLVKQISQGDYYEPKKPSRASPLIREMLTVCPQRRANIEQICNHWWVNEGYSESCLDIAEALANQTPVRLDVLLSLSPPSVTADQLVVPSGEDTKANIPRSHSVGSIREIGNTEAERRILDMVAAGGEAALMPSPTRTITPNESPVQPKRKLESTVSTENAVGIVKKKERPTEEDVPQEEEAEEMEVEEEQEDVTNLQECPSEASVERDPINAGATEEEPKQEALASAASEENAVQRQKTVPKLDAVNEAEEIPQTAKEISPQKVIKKFVNKHKTADLVAAINKMSEDKNDELQRSQTCAERKSSLPDENLGRRRSRIMETAEKFQNLSNSTSDKPKKIVIAGSTVSNFKKEFERKAADNTLKATSPGGSPPLQTPVKPAKEDKQMSSAEYLEASEKENELSESESKASVESFSLKEARRSMENSIALLNQAKEESTREVEQLCAQTENIAFTEPDRDNEKKKAREIISNAIQPGGRLCLGVRKPPVPFGVNGRSISGSVVPPMSSDKKTMRVQVGPESGEFRTATVSVSTPEHHVYDKEPPKLKTTAKVVPVESSPTPSGTKTSRAEITLKSATLPRRKPAKTEIQLEIKPRPAENTMRFSTEMQHQVPDLRSAPVREGPYSPIATSAHQRATSLEPAAKEHVIAIQRPSAYVRSGSNSYRSGSLSRQSTNESDSDITACAQSQSTIASGTSSTSQPIKKSPREFIIPIAVEGGGYVTPRAGSLEPSDSSHTTSSAAFSRVNRPRRIGSLFAEEESGDDSHFHKMRTTSINRDIDAEEPRFTMHRLRSTRPIKKLSQETNDSQSSGEDDDEDGFEILTAENLFSTLLQRVRALTNRLNVNNDLTAGFPNSSRLLGNMRQAHSPFWQQEPFGRLNDNSGTGAAWRHSFSRDLGSDIDSMFSRTGATLPRGSKKLKDPQKLSSSKDKEKEVALDLADLDLSRLRLTKKDLETLSTITPNLPKCFQEQLLAKLPPTQARKLSRTLSMQNSGESVAAVAGPGRIYKRSLSGGRELSEKTGSGSSENRSLCEKESRKERSEMSSSSNERPLDNGCRRGSLGREKYGYEVAAAAAAKSRSSSTCKSGDDYSRSLCSSYTSDVSDRYKYYSPYLAKRSDPERPISPYFDKESDIDRSISPYKYYESSSSPRNSCFSPVKEVYGRPPSGCLSPPPVLTDGSLRRRSSQRRISRFLRPDFFEPPVNDENAYVREKKLREREAQSVLREIREKSRERSHDRRNHSVERVLSCEDQLDNADRPLSMRHVRNRSTERLIDLPARESEELLQRRRRSVSRPREIVDDTVNNIVLQAKTATKKMPENQLNDDLMERRRRRSVSRPRELSDIASSERFDAGDVANKILEELQNISRDTNTTGKHREVNSSSENQSTIIDDSVKEKVVKVKKVKTKDATAKKEKKATSSSMKEASLLEKPTETKTASDDKIKKESKLVRPKSYPIKEPEKGLSMSCVKFDEHSPSPPDKSESLKQTKSLGEEKDKEKARISRPKSYPNSKITPPKELKKFGRSGMGISAVMEKLMEKAEKPATTTVKKTPSKSSSSEEKQLSSKSSDSTTITEQKPIKKVVKKKVVKCDTKQSPESKYSPVEETTTVAKEPSKKDKSPEKKVNKGILYAIGQKFKNLQENAKSKEKKLASCTSAATTTPPEQSSPKEADVSVTLVLKKKKPKTVLTPESLSPENVGESSAAQKAEEKAAKSEKRSRIDAMIRSLRERSLPRASVMTESGLIKRAVSVEDVSGAFTKCGVNKVLGLFKKYEKDDGRKVMNTRSTSNIERQITYVHVQKERPKSSGFMGKLKKSSANASADTLRDEVVKAKEPEPAAENKPKVNIASPSVVAKAKAPLKDTCQECVLEFEMDARTRNAFKVDIGEKEKSKEKRKGLLLDFSKIDNFNNKAKVDNHLANNYVSHSYGVFNNNNGYIGNNGEINQNSVLTPSNETMTNYSSSSKSPHDDCPSSSTFLSPSEEPELCFDNWSICSEDNYGVSTPSPTVSRLSRASQLSSPISLDANNPESVIDRIKRRSFYIRFNEKKPKRQSNIVGPGARDYYRESSVKARSRPSDRISSPEADPATNATPEYLKPLKLSSNTSDLKPPSIQVRRRYDDDLRYANTTSADYMKPRSVYNDVLPSASTITKRYGDTDHIRRYEPSYASSLYNTYSPKRRSSYTSNGFVPVSSSSVIAASDRMNNIDGYATLGRLHTSTQNTAKSPSASAFRRDHHRTASDFGNLPKLGSFLSFEVFTQ